MLQVQTNLLLKRAINWLLILQLPFFFVPRNNFQCKKEDFICKQSDRHFPLNPISVGLYLFLDTASI